jgi:hypothetical protein
MVAPFIEHAACVSILWIFVKEALKAADVLPVFSRARLIVR